MQMAEGWLSTTTGLMTDCLAELWLIFFAELNGQSRTPGGWALYERQQGRDQMIPPLVFHSVFTGK